MNLDIKRLLVKLLAGVLGLFIGLLCFALSLVAMGLGEVYGWESQGYFSLMAIFLTPYAFFGFAYSSAGSITSTKVLLYLALLLDVLLVVLTFFEWRNHPNHNFSGAPIWLASWSVWQIAVLGTFFLQRRSRKSRGQPEAPPF